MASDALVWQRRAEQARRLAATLAPRDALLIDGYARECECKGRCLSDLSGHRRCGVCPVMHGEADKQELRP